MDARALAMVGLLLAACASCGEAADGGGGTHPIPTNPALRTPEERGATAQRGAQPTPTPPPTLSERELAQARDRFMEGVRLYEAGSYTDALQQFSAAYELAPRPEILFNIATCQEQLGDIRGAVVTYQHYLADAEVPADLQGELREKIRALESQLGIER